MFYMYVFYLYFINSCYWVNKTFIWTEYNHCFVFEGGTHNLQNHIMYVDSLFSIPILFFLL